MPIFLPRTKIADQLIEYGESHTLLRKIHRMKSPKVIDAAVVIDQERLERLVLLIVKEALAILENELGQVSAMRLVEKIIAATGEAP